MRSLLVLGLAAGALAGGTELKDAKSVKERFSKKAVTQPTILGYLPTLDAVDAFNEASGGFPTIPAYYVHDRAALDALGLVGKDAVVALLRPWAGSKKFKVTFRGDLSTPKYRDWLVNEALGPIPYVAPGLSAAWEASAERQRKVIVKAYLSSERPDPKSVKPDDWDQPEKIPDPEGVRPEDWSDEDDGEWEANQIPNPAFKGPWVQARMSTLIPDPSDTKPEDWEQPKEIPDPRATVPEDWDAEEDGAFEPPEIPNPGYKGEWNQKQVPIAEEVEALKALLKPVAEKLDKKAIVIIQDASTVFQMRAEYKFTDEEFAANKAIAIEESKYSAMQQKNTWITYKYDGEKSITEWADDWSSKKLVDMDKAARAAKKEARLSKAKKA